MPRSKTATGQPQQTPYFPLGGGLDLITPAIAQKPGGAIGALNYEPQATGYRRVAGFERFDGQVSPTDAPYYELDWTGGSAVFNAGDVITGATSGATGKVLATGVATSGIYDGSAAGYVGIGAVTGTFVNGENLKVGGVTRAVANGSQQLTTAPDDVTASAWQAQATANARALIQKLPGTGATRGVWEYKNNIYGWRDQPELMHNGNFADGTITGWTPSGNAPQATLSWVAGALRIQAPNPAGSYPSALYTFGAVVAGLIYEFQFDIVGGNAPAAFTQITDGAGFPVTQLNHSPSPGTYKGSFVAGSGNHSIVINMNGAYNGCYLDIDNVSIRLASTMWKATTTGWQNVPLGYTLDFTNGGTYVPQEGDVITGASSGKTATVMRVVTQSGSYSAKTAAGYLVLASASGTFTAGETFNIGANTNVGTLTADKAAIVLPLGGRYELLNYNFSGASQSFRMYGCNGVGQAFEFDGTTFTPIRSGMPTDTPHRIAEHQNHLFLAFPGGQFQNSAIGQPLNWTAVQGAAAFGMGDEITDFIANNATILTILAQNKVASLYGSSAVDFQLQTLSDEAGALPFTADKVGEPIYMDVRGLRSLSTTQNYGDFDIGSLSLKVKPLLQDFIKTGITPVASVRVRNKDLYKVIFSNGQGLAFFFGNLQALAGSYMTAEPQQQQPDCLPFNWGKNVTCIGSFEMNGGERVFFGTDEGYVYEGEKGYSFDGAAIAFSLRLPFNHQGAPQTLKRWHKVVVECQAIPTATISVAADFDYGSPFEVGATPQDAIAQDFTVTGGGGIWDISNWNQFYWSGATEGLMEAYLDGVGRNMSLYIAGSSASEPPHLLQGLTLFFTVRGLQR